MRTYTVFLLLSAKFFCSGVGDSAKKHKMVTWLIWANTPEPNISRLGPLKKNFLMKYSLYMIIFLKNTLAHKKPYEFIFLWRNESWRPTPRIVSGIEMDITYSSKLFIYLEFLHNRSHSCIECFQHFPVDVSLRPSWSFDTNARSGWWLHGNTSCSFVVK